MTLIPVAPLLRAFDAAQAVANKARTVVASQFGQDEIRALGAAASMAGSLLFRPTPSPSPVSDAQIAQVTSEPPRAEPVPISVGQDKLKSGDDFVLTAARDAALKVSSVAKAWGNLWRIDVYEARKSDVSGDAIPLLELFAKSVRFGAVTISGEAEAIGGAFVDAPSGASGTQISISTGDDLSGSIRKWFSSKAEMVVSGDGTFGVPADYLLTIEITSLRRLPNGGTVDAFSRKFLVRPGSSEEEMDRMTAEILSVSLTFEPGDTFVSPSAVTK